MNISENNTVYINYLEAETLIYLPYLILNFFGIVIGTIGNHVFNISIFSKEKKMLLEKVCLILFGRRFKQPFYLSDTALIFECKKSENAQTQRNANNLT